MLNELLDKLPDDEEEQDEEGEREIFESRELNEENEEWEQRERQKVADDLSLGHEWDDTVQKVEVEDVTGSPVISVDPAEIEDNVADDRA